MRHRIINDYFEWLYSMVCDKPNMHYRRLLMHLHNVEFTYFVGNDDNRAEDGMDLRDLFAYDRNYRDVELALDDPCSVLEMLVALAHRCEEHIMEDLDIGDRTGQWFWLMIENMGLLDMDDDNYDEEVVDDAIRVLLNREFEPDGARGIFSIPNCKYDLREVEFWFHLCWYLNTIV